jgi:hypothetical protein
MGFNQVNKPGKVQVSLNGIGSAIKSELSDAKDVVKNAAHAAGSTIKETVKDAVGIDRDHNKDIKRRMSGHSQARDGRHGR